MKLKLLLVLGLSVSAVNGASLAFGNLSFSGTDLFLVDNAGVGLGAGSTASFFAGTSPTSLADISSLGTALEVITFNTGNNPSPSFIASQFDVPNFDGALTNQNLFVVFSNPTGDQFAAIDFAAIFPVDDSPTAPVAVVEDLNVASRVTLGAVGPVTTFQDPVFGEVIGQQLSLAAVPEPSIALLGGLALFGGLVRRRR